MAATDPILDALVDRVLERVQPQIDALRAENERLRTAADSTVTIHEAASRLGRSVRHVQRCLRDGRLTEAPAVAGVRMVQWPSSAGSASVRGREATTEGKRDDHARRVRLVTARQA